MADFDAIVIGSGMGGLATAALLARVEGRRVLVLERHWRAGGFTHAFSRPGGWRWDVGVHYVGADAVRPGMARDVFAVTTGGALAGTTPRGRDDARGDRRGDGRPHGRGRHRGPGAVRRRAARRLDESAARAGRVAPKSTAALSRDG